MHRLRYTVVTGMPIGVVVALGAVLLVYCSPPCTDPAECDCPNPTGAGRSALVVLADHASPVVEAAMERLTADDGEVFEDGSLGLEGKPEMVILATYDDGGHVEVHSRHNLAGEGPDQGTKENDAELQANCFAEEGGNLPADGDGGNFVGALPDAAELALAATQDGEDGAAAVVAFGLSRSHIDETRFVPTEPARTGDPGEEVVDLREPETRQEVIDELVRTRILIRPQPVAFTFVAPDEGVEDGALAGLLTTFAEEELCEAVAVDFCTVRGQL